MMSNAFFEALAATEHDAHWLELAAGLVVLRLADSALQGREPDAETLEEVRHEVMKVTDFGILNPLLELIESASVVALDPLEYRDDFGRQLVAYGGVLHQRGDQGPATDFFALVCEHLADDVELYFSALGQRAFAFRELSQWDAATTNYTLLWQMAEQFGQNDIALEARLGAARVRVERGNHRAGAAELEAVVAEADRLGYADLRAKALVDQAAVAGMMFDPAGAIRYGERALEVLDDPIPRNRCLVIMATAHRERGNAVEAERCAREAQDKTTQAYVRTEAAVLLYDLATDRGDRSAQRWQHFMLAGATLAPLTSARFHYAIAREEATAGHFKEADAVLVELLEFTQRHRLHELTIRIDEARKDVAHGRVPVIYEYRPARPVSIESEAPVVRYAGVSRAHDVPAPASTISVASVVVAVGS